MYYCLSNELFLYKSAIQNSKSVRTQISVPDLYSFLQPNSANNLNDTTNIMTFHFSLKPIAIELRTVIVCILCKLRIYGPPLHKNSWETRKWQVNLGQPGTFYHFSHAQTKRKHLTRRTNRFYPTKNTMGPMISKVAWIKDLWIYGRNTQIVKYILKVSKYRKQNTKFSHPPKNQRNFVHFFALASKKWLKQKIKVLDLNYVVVRGYLKQLKSFYLFDSTTFRR